MGVLIPRPPPTHANRELGPGPTVVTAAATYRGPRFNDLSCSGPVRIFGDNPENLAFVEITLCAGKLL